MKIFFYALRDYDEKKYVEECAEQFGFELDAGGRTLMVCNGHSIIEPGYFEVFRKYCGKE